MPAGRKKRNYINNDIKKLSATFLGDEAIEVDLFEKSLRIDRNTKTKTERDNILVSLGLNALQYCIKEYQQVHQVKYPTYQNLIEFLDVKSIELIGKSHLDFKKHPSDT